MFLKLQGHCKDEQTRDTQKIDIAINSKLRGLKPITSIKGWKGLTTFTAGVINSTYFHARSNLAELKQKPKFLVQGRLTSISNGKFKIAGLGLFVDIKLPKNCRVTYAIVEPSKLTIFYNEFTKVVIKTGNN